MCSRWHDQRQRYTQRVLWLRYKKHAILPAEERFPPADYPRPRDPFKVKGERARTWISAYHAQTARPVRSIREGDVNCNTARTKPMRTPMRATAVFPLVIPLRFGVRNCHQVNFKIWTISSMNISPNTTRRAGSNFQQEASSPELATIALGLKVNQRVRGSTMLRCPPLPMTTLI